MPETVSVAPPRTWEELSTEVQLRTDRQVYPLTGMRPEDVRDILGRIHSLDDDEWGRSWAQAAAQWMQRGLSLESTDRQAAADAFIMAWRYASFGAWPSATSSEKRRSFALGVDAFAHYGRLQDQPIERIEVPFDGGVIPILLQLPKAPGPVPVMLSVGGLDSFKEYVAERYGPVYLAAGIGWVGLDAPNTGETLLLPRPGVEKAYSAVIDYLLTRQDVDAGRIGLQGVSMGGYWATRIALAEPQRLKLAVNWAGPLDAAWAPRQIRGALSSKEYLFGLPAALLAQSGWSSLGELVERQQELSIVGMQLVDKPTPARMLIVNGLKDSLVPAEDTLLMLRHGTPKSAWINPEGIHLARSAEWNDERIMREVILPWIAEGLRA